MATEPVNPGEPGAAPTAPVQADYFVTAEEYGKLDASAQADYTPDTTNPDYYYNSTNSYTSYENAKAAYDAAQSAYTTAKDEYDAKKAAYDKYLTDKAAYDTQHADYKKWYDYFKSVADENAANQAVADAAAKNTVVKTASFNTASPAAIADAAAVNTKGSHVYLPGGSVAEMQKSLAFIAALPLPDETKVLPGHERFSTLGAERRQNPCLTGDLW